MQHLKKKALSKSISEIKASGRKVWFTSDLHYFHDNVIKYSYRPTTKEQQTEWITKQMNDNIGEDDIVYHLGDFTFSGPKNIEKVREVLKQLKGHWRFILGNHDNESMLRELIKEFPQHEVLGHYQEIKYNKTKFVLCHFPFKTWNCSSHGSVNIHGHCHGELTKRHFKNKFVRNLATMFGFDKRKQPINQIDVGIDSIDGFKPIEIDDLIKFIELHNPKKKTVNHHGRDNESFLSKLKFWSVKNDTRNL